MNSLNDEVCAYNSEPVTENFRTCKEADGKPYFPCPSNCAFLPRGTWTWKCIDI